MYRLLQENVKLTTVFAVVNRGQLLVSSSVFSPCRDVGSLMVDCWLRGRSGGFPSPFIDYCYLIGRQDLPWPYGWKDHSHFWIWCGQRNLAIFLLQNKIIISSCLSPTRPASKCQLWAGWGGGEMLSANAVHRDSHPSPFCYFSPSPNVWYISLFSLKSFNIYLIFFSIFFCIFQHLMQSKRYLRSHRTCTTKNSNSGTFLYLLVSFTGFLPLFWLFSKGGRSAGPWFLVL
jgi:hypothetical protein